MLFSKIVPNCKKLGLLERNDKWLRHRFEEMGVIQFEDSPTPARSTPSSRSTPRPPELPQANEGCSVA